MKRTPHDALFKALLSDPQRAGAFLRDHLPNEVMNQTGYIGDDLVPILRRE